ncbi:hypothetical protein BsWGS_21466 [Bradybaena similaris]
MALVTIQRSPSPSTDPDLDADSLDDVSDGRSQLRKSLSESYFTIRGAALILPHTECTKKTTKKNHGGEIQSHLQAMLNLLRPEDTIKIAVRLQDTSQFHRYIALVSTKGRQDTEEAVVLGIDCTSTSASIGLVLPMWMGLRIKLGGDGGFSLCTDELSYLFKPTSVQAMWSAIQSLYKALRIAEDMNYIPDGLTHTWVGYYKSRVDNRSSSRVCQWNVEGVEIFAPSSLSIKANECERENVKLNISNTLKEVMLDFDLDEATSVMLRTEVEHRLEMSLAEYKSYFDEEVMRIVGQMDKPSEILEFLYLGSEWNASNLEELLEKGIGYILNVTREIDNFFEGKFQYFNVRVVDVDESDLLKHWDKTYKFISKARSHNSKVLVHCKMGVSRSASTVMAFIMKDQRLTVNEAFQFVKERRGCVHPNSGFMEQLRTYEGILSASNKRDIFRCKSEQNLMDEGSKDESESSQGDFLGDSLFRMMSHSDWQSASGSVTCEEEYIYSINKDLEAAESRSADSTEESATDVPSLRPETTAVSCSSQAPSTVKAAPVFIVRPSIEASAFDKEMSQERGASSEPESATVLSSSEDSVTLQLRGSSNTLPSRIKPDSSWIKFEAAELGKCDTCGETLPFIDALSGDDASSLSPPSHMCALGKPEALSQGEEIHCQGDTSGESTIVSPTTTLPFSLVSSPHLSNLSPEKSTPAAFSTDVHFYIGNIHNPLDTKPTSAISSDFIKAQGATISNIFLSSKKHSHTPAFPSDSAASQGDHISSLKPTPLEEIIPAAVAREEHEEPAEVMSTHAETTLDKSEAKVEDKEAASANNTRSRTPRNKIELGVRQYFIREKIPWKPGKVRKMQEDINKTGQISQDEDNEDGGDVKTFKKLPEVQDTHDECSFLEQMSEHQPATSLCQSHSCGELCGLQECDSAQLSVYQREEIPLIPGTVSRLRTWLEVADKEGLLCGEGDQEANSTPHPVDLSPSLKLERGTARSKYTDNRRFTTGHSINPDKPLVDLQSVEVSDDALANLRPTVPQSSSQMEERNEDVVNKLENGHETDNIQAQTVMKSTNLNTAKSSLASFSVTSSSTLSVQTTSVTADAENAETRRSDFQPSCTSRQKEQVTNDSFDSEILVQEIASSLIVSSSPPKADDIEDQPCANMVKYYVQKIEKQGVASPQTEKQTVASPQTEKQTVASPVVENDTKKTFSPIKDETSKVKYLPDGETMSYDIALLASLSAAVHAKITKSSDLTMPLTRSTHETSVDLAHTMTNMQSDSTMQLNTQGNFMKTSDSGSSRYSRLSLSLKLDSSASLLPQVSSPMLEDVGKISLSSPVSDVQGQFPVLPEMRRPDSTASPRSSGLSHVHDSIEPSVVRNLVGHFENRSPEPERGSFDISHDLTWKPGHDISSSSQAAPLRSQKEYNLIQSRVEDITTQPLASSFQPSYRPVDLSTHQCSSSAANIDLLASASPAALSASPRLTLHRKHVSLDSASSSTDSCMRNPFNCDIPVELHELHSDFGSIKETSAGSLDSSSKRLGPFPFNRSSLENTEKKAWRSVRPTSVELPHSASSVEHKSVSSGVILRPKERSSYSSFTAVDDDVSLRQVSDEGRKIRRLQGKSHPLTKLSEPRLGKGPFYSSM